jgi:hypothetical protein
MSKSTDCGFQQLYANSTEESNIKESFDQFKHVREEQLFFDEIIGLDAFFEHFD